MREKMGTRASRTGRDRHDDAFDLTALLHPAQAFAQPMDVVNDPDLTLSEKRAILAAWASDSCAVEAVPALRRAPGQVEGSRRLLSLLAAATIRVPALRALWATFS